MGVEFILKKIKKLKYLIAISLIVIFILGYVSALVFNSIKYRSTGEVDYYAINSLLARNINSDFYYFFFRWYKSYQKDDSLEPNGLVNYYGDDRVLKKTYEYILSEGYNMDYNTFKKGLTTYYRDTNLQKRIVVVFDDKQLSIITLNKLLEFAPQIYNETMTNRINIEINARKEHDEVLLKRINNLKQKIFAQKEKESLKIKLKVVEKVYKENYEYIIKLQQIVDFKFAELFKKHEQVLEKGTKIDNKTITIGLIGVLVAIILWILYFYICYIKEELQKENNRN